MKNFVMLFFAIGFTFLVTLVKGQGYYWVAFTDKNNTEFTFTNPQAYLSDRSVERRIKQNIAIDSLDLPVNSIYIDSVLSVGANSIHSSKWLNGVTVYSELEDFESRVRKFTFVKEVQFTKPKKHVKSSLNKFIELSLTDKEPVDSSFYGSSVFQTGLLNGQYLHNRGFNGEGMQIAVLDAGFLNVDEYFAFDSLWANNQILGVKDFVNPDSDIFETHYHGMSVLSCMGGNVPGELIGTARKAQYWLLRSEDDNSEYLIEEDNWVVAAEFADSIGVDIINSSLGYYEFDDPAMNHTYTDMDGNTTRVTKAANIAVSKGIVVFSSAGNEGNDPWKYIIAPSDGDKVIGVGATNALGVAAPFTSFGPASDGEIKPNASALGWGTYLQQSHGGLGFSNGTSFSSPVLAGMAACLWQANPFATAFEVKQAIEQSAHLYHTPDSLLGYGIPDMKLADQILESTNDFPWAKDKSWMAYPNPLKEYIILQHKPGHEAKEVTIEIFSADGRFIQKRVLPFSPKIVLNKLQSLPLGILLFRIRTENNTETIKMFKFQ